MNNIKLVIPKKEHENEAKMFAKEVMQIDGDGIHGSSDLYETESFELWLDNISRNAAGETVNNLSPSDTLFAIRECDNKIIGIINIRHRLNNDFMLTYGGHIGYTVRPGERCKGYATQMLRLALKCCINLGIKRVLLTCDPINNASCRVIESCNGVIENEIPYENSTELVRRYWIDI
jgi:predicted acetyltransferase